MAIVRAVKTGNWSDTTVWNTGALPTSADDVYSNTFTVTIDTSPTVLRVSNATTTGVSAGGSFMLTNGVTLTCTGSGVVAGPATLIVSSLTSAQSASLIGNVFGGTTVGAAGVSNTADGTLNIIGNVSQSTSVGTAHGALNSANGTINITGNITCSGGSPAHGVVNNSTGSVNITGNVSGGTSAGTAYGVLNNSTGTVTITGIVTGGTGGNTNTFGVLNNGTGVLTIIGSLVSNNSPAVSSPSFSGVNIFTGPFLTNANGINPIQCIRWFWQNTTPPATYYQIRSANLSVIRPLYTADSVGGNPAIANVRSGTVYGPSSELTGTCAVPGASSVASGVPVDATTGTAVLTAAALRSAMGLASANLDTQLATISSATAPSAATIASQVRTELATELGRIDVATSSRLAPAGTLAVVTTLTNAPTVPTAAQIATATRSELATELGRIDVATSSRLAPAGTLARVTLTDTATTLTNAPTVPTTSQIASQVRTELAVELARVSNCATVESTGDQITALSS